MSRLPTDPPATRFVSPSGLRIEINANGSVSRMELGDTLLNLFIGNELEGGPANLYLRRHASSIECTALLGPRSPTQFGPGAQPDALHGSGTWQGIAYRVTLVLAQAMPAWFWHVQLHNMGDTPQDLDLIHAQDLALAPYGAVRLNEYYVSQYVDHTPLTHAGRGCVVASRQNQAAGGRNPWCVIGSLREGVSFATDALQLHGLASRAGGTPAGLLTGLPGRRLQHEHSMVAIQDAVLRLAPGADASLGFFGCCAADHPDATSADDLSWVDRVLALPEASPPAAATASAVAPAPTSLFSSAALLDPADLDDAQLAALFGTERRHEERDAQGRCLSFFHGTDRHVVMAAKERAVRRPHGHLLRSGRHQTPDESALTSTVWMGGVFHSMLTQGHVSINRLLSTVHSYLGLFRSHGQRVFIELESGWQLLDLPSAFEMAPEACRWIYRHAGGVIEVRSAAHSDPHAMSLSIVVREGSPLRCLICHHIALNSDDGSIPGGLRWWRDAGGVGLAPQPDSELGRRFPEGSFRIVPDAGTVFEQIGGDELLFSDGRSHKQPFLCVVTAAASAIGLRVHGRLVDEGVPEAAEPSLAPELRIAAPVASPLAEQVARLDDVVPWYAHNALVHYLSPRGLEQYSGGGWGTRDVCQGPLEMLLALGRVQPVRDLLLRVMRAQNPDGDWPQWFMFFERERTIRAGDSHGDIVFWPVLALAQYLIASGDASVLDEPVPFFHPDGNEQAEHASVWQHAERALALIGSRVVGGTALAAYGHGDWNDALQPADPAMREHMCSAWTVTLHYQTLLTLARALRGIGRDGEAMQFEAQADAVRRDFQRVLLVDGVLAGYALFEGQGAVRLLLHPRDGSTGVHFSALAMIHAILEDLLTPAQARAHLQLIDARLSGPDGVRLFDRPMPYHGGPQRHFQRAESATFFGREIGLMYTHAHLRYAQALAHVGEAERFFHALCQANPIGIRSVVPSATLRQANCYYSSSDAAFDDRYQASAEYARVAQGTVALDGGWRVYSSGAGIALGLIVRRFLGLSCEAATLSLDPVIPPALDGLSVQTTLWGHAVEVVYAVKRPGWGVTAVEVNGEALSFTHAANPHRVGAAQLPAALLTARLGPGSNRMRVSVG